MHVIFKYIYFSLGNHTVMKSGNSIAKNGTINASELKSEIDIIFRILMTSKLTTMNNEEFIA